MGGARRCGEKARTSAFLGGTEWASRPRVVRRWYRVGLEALNPQTLDFTIFFTHRGKGLYSYCLPRPWCEAAWKRCLQMLVFPWLALIPHEGALPCAPRILAPSTYPLNMIPQLRRVDAAIAVLVEEAKRLEEPLVVGIRLELRLLRVSPTHRARPRARGSRRTREVGSASGFGVWPRKFEMRGGGCAPWWVCAAAFGSFSTYVALYTNT